jgi:hypothetical protein
LAVSQTLRPAFALVSVAGADFFRVRAPQSGATPTFALRDVDNFSAGRCGRLRDTRLDHVEEKLL